MSNPVNDFKTEEGLWRLKDAGNEVSSSWLSVYRRSEDGDKVKSVERQWQEVVG